MFKRLRNLLCLALAAGAIGLVSGCGGSYYRVGYSSYYGPRWCDDGYGYHSFSYGSRGHSHWGYDGHGGHSDHHGGYSGHGGHGGHGGHH